MITIATPASSASAAFEYRPFVTTSPSPRPPIRPAITTSESANMIVWLTDEQQLLARERQLHLEERLQRRRAQRLRGLDRVGGHAADAERRDPDGRRDGVDHRADDRRGRADREQDHDRHQVGERGHDLHRVEHRRDARGGRARSARRTRRAACRSSSERTTAASISASVWMLGSHSPISANATNAASTMSPARQPPKRQHEQRAGGGGADPRQPLERVGERGDEPVGERAEAVEDREDEVRVLRGALVEQPALQVVEVLGQLRSTSARPATGTRRAAARRRPA